MKNAKDDIQILQKKVNEYESLLNSITDGFFSLDNDWRFSGMNNAFVEMCGTTRESLLGKSYWEQFPKSKTQKFYTEYQKAKKEMSVRHFEEYSTTLNKWVAVNVYPTETAINIYFVDVTREHNMRTELAHNEHNISALINNTSDLIWSLDMELNILYANASFVDLIKSQKNHTVKPGESVLFDTMGDEQRRVWQVHYNRALAGEKFSVVQEENGSAYETFFSPIKGDDGTIRGLSCFSRDITERLSHIKEIEKQNERLQEIAWLYSHKVRNHVATILGLAQLLDDKDYINPDHKNVIQGLVSSATDLDNVIASINNLDSDKNTPG